MRVESLSYLLLNCHLMESYHARSQGKVFLTSSSFIQQLKSSANTTSKEEPIVIICESSLLNLGVSVLNHLFQSDLFLNKVFFLSVNFSLSAKVHISVGRLGIKSSGYFIKFLRTKILLIMTRLEIIQCCEWCMP